MNRHERTLNKKILAFAMSVMLIWGVDANAIITSATETTQRVNEEDIMPDGTIPSSDWNISKKGQYNFSGKADLKLYTLYNFYGKTHYSTTVTNNGTSKLYVKAVRASDSSHIYDSVIVSPGSKMTFEFSGIKSTTRFYLVFTSENAFRTEGNIR